MEARALYIRVGALIVGGVGLLIALIWFLGGNQIRHGTLYSSYFSESVQGLEVGAPVKYRGVTIGRVSAIGLVSAEYGGSLTASLERRTYRLVFVRFEVDTSRIGPVPETAEAVNLGLRTRVASQGLTGLSYIELDFVNPTRYPALEVPWSPKAAYIPSMPSTLFQVQDAAQELLRKLDRIDIEKLAIEAAGLLSDLRSELTQGDVHATLEAAKTLLGTLDHTVQAADLPGLTADIRRTSSALRDTVQGEQTQKLLTNAALAADRMANAAAKLPPLITALQATAQRAGNGTADLEQSLVPLLRDLTATAQNLRETTEALRRYPAGVLSGPPPRGMEPGR